MHPYAPENSIIIWWSYNSIIIWRSYNSIITWRSYNKSNCNTVRFDRSLLTCSCQRGQKPRRFSSLALEWLAGKHGSERVKLTMLKEIKRNYPSVTVHWERFEESRSGATAVFIYTRKQNFILRELPWRVLLYALQLHARRRLYLPEKSSAGTVLVSNWISMSCQPHRITSGWSNSIITKRTLQNSPRIYIYM